METREGKQVDTNMVFVINYIIASSSKIFQLVTCYIVIITMTTSRWTAGVESTCACKGGRRGRRTTGGTTSPQDGQALLQGGQSSPHLGTDTEPFTRHNCMHTNRLELPRLSCEIKKYNVINWEISMSTVLWNILILVGEMKGSFWDKSQKSDQIHFCQSMTPSPLFVPSCNYYWAEMRRKQWEVWAHMVFRGCLPLASVFWKSFNPYFVHKTFHDISKCATRIW